MFHSANVLADLLDLPQGRLAVWLVILIGVLLVGLVVVQQVKKRMNASDTDENDRYSAGFTLSDLRELHKAGEMSDEEFAKAKAKVIEAARRAAARDANQTGKAIRAFPIEPKPQPPMEENEPDGNEDR